MKRKSVCLLLLAAMLLPCSCRKTEPVPPAESVTATSAETGETEPHRGARGDVSRDGETFTKAADYSQMSTARASGTNQAVVLITADTVPGTGDAIYIRLRNTDPKQGWGGAVLRFEFQCLKEKK